MLTTLITEIQHLIFEELDNVSLRKVAQSSKSLNKSVSIFFQNNSKKILTEQKEFYTAIELKVRPSDYLINTKNFVMYKKPRPYERTYTKENTQEIFDTHFKENGLLLFNNKEEAFEYAQDFNKYLKFLSESSNGKNHLHYLEQDRKVALIYKIQVADNSNICLSKWNSEMRKVLLEKEIEMSTKWGMEPDMKMYENKSCFRTKIKTICLIEVDVCLCGSMLPLDEKYQFQETIKFTQEPGLKNIKSTQSCIIS